MNPWIVIPSYQPTKVLEDFVEALIVSGFECIIVVDDGSDLECENVFKEVVRHPQVILLRHEVNLGKGAALKTGINYFLLHAHCDVPGIITADADGQHLSDDVVKLSLCAAKQPDSMLIGAREFDTSRPVPLRSRLGNIITRNLFSLLLKRKLLDTQTGLRYLSAFFIPEVIKIGSNGYEFEFEMLIKAVSSNIKIIEIPIRTVYFDSNEHSHFNPLLDSFKIYFVFIRFFASSIATALIDYTIFVIIHWVTHNILCSLICGRILAVVFNFLIVKNLVFHSHKNTLLELPKYLLTVFIMTSLSYFGITLLTNYLDCSVLISKFLVEGILFPVTFLVMRLIVFKRR